ncbi:MAG: hypothetical protein ACREQ9_04290, partial [Candidatus Binatia bacterium]
AGVLVAFALSALRERAVRREYVEFGGALLATLAVTFLLSVSHGHGLRNWSEFADNLRVHTRQSAGYRIGVQHLLAYHGEITAADPFVSYAQKAKQVGESRWRHVVLVALFGVPLLLVMRRLDATSGAIVFGTTLLFLLLNATRYYYSVLALLAFVTPGEERSWQPKASIALLLLASGALYVAEGTNDFAPFLYNYLFSALLFLYFAFLLTSLAWEARAGAPRREPAPPPGSRLGSNPIRAAAALAAVAALLLLWWGFRPGEAVREDGAGAVHCCDPSVLLREDDMSVVARTVARLWRGEPLPPGEALLERFATPAQGVYAAVRSRGERVTHGWEASGTVLDALGVLLRRLRAEVGAARAEGVDVIEIDLSHSYRELHRDDRHGARMLFANVRRGVNGLELSRGERRSRYAPTWSIATNRDNARWMELFRQENRLDERELRSEVRTRMFDAEQLLVFLRPEPAARLLFRGNEIVPVEAVTRAAVRKTADLAIRWLADNVHDDGRLTYKYWPSAGEESAANNMIRQWMATIALEKDAAKRGDPRLWERIERNIDYNLVSFYREEDGLGLIEWENEVKLGAVALATIALVEHPRRQKWGRQEAALRRTVEALWNADGSFDTFYRPRERNDNQNFYPGEALLLWSILYERERDPELLARFWKSFEYYRAWHLDERRRNPAFIPWHTQADYNVWRITRDERLRRFVFEMNDWLLPVQQW